MKLYNLGYYYEEGGADYLFTHPENKTQEEFDADAKSLIRKYGYEFMAQQEGWIGNTEWIDYVAGKMPELGYERVTPITTSFYARFILKDDEDSYYSQEWYDVVGPDLYNKALEYNKKVEEDMGYNRE